MIKPNWKRRADLDGSVCHVMSMSGLSVYEDLSNYCLHIMRGDSEFTSVMLPWDSNAMNELREQAYSLHNDKSDEYRQAVKDGHDKLEEQQKIYNEEFTRDVVDDVMRKCYWGRVPGVINPGVPKNDSE